MWLTLVSLKEVCLVPWRALLSHNSQRHFCRVCLKLLTWPRGNHGQVMCHSNGPPDWELRESAWKSVQLSHSENYIFRTTYPHEPKIGYLWSVGPLLFLHIFISSVRVVVGLSVNFKRRWIHQSLKICVSQKWMKWGQMFIKHANMMLKSFIVIRSIRTCKLCLKEYFRKYKNSIKTTKTRAATQLLLAQYLQKKQTNSHLY